jgi:crotonobetaine/carnitine-CoA ligase
MLDARAARHPDRRLALFEDGSSWTYGECRAEVRAAAAALQRLGVVKGDKVIAWLPTGRAMVLTWFAANYLGAVFVPLNTAYRGDVLAHVVNAAGASVMVAYHSLLDRLEPLDLPQLRTIVVVGSEATGSVSGRTLLPESTLRGAAAQRSNTGTSSRSSTPRARPVTPKGCSRPTCNCISRR